MKRKEKIKFKLEPKILTSYVEAMISIKEPMKEIKAQLSQLSNLSYDKFLKSNVLAEKTVEQLKNIHVMSKTIEDLLATYPNEQSKIIKDIIIQIMNVNNGMLSTRMIEPLNINRQYLSIMEDNNMIEKASRGIYLFPNTFEDSYFSFQQKYKKVVFSHMNALYFYGLTEEFPYDYTVTVPQRYHVDTVNEKCNVFYVSEEIYEMGISEVETPSGNKVRVYDKERCICDVIRSKGRMDKEQVKKTIKQYIKCSDKDINKLVKYSKKLGINEMVSEIVGAYYE